MAKIIRAVEVTIRADKDDAGNITVQENSDLLVSAEEYPELEIRKSISIELTEAQEKGIINHIKDVVLPQAEASK